MLDVCYAMHDLGHEHLMIAQQRHDRPSVTAIIECDMAMIIVISVTPNMMSHMTQQSHRATTTVEAALVNRS